MTKSAIPFFDNMRLQILENMKDWKVGKFVLVSDWLPYNWKAKNCVDDWAYAKKAVTPIQLHEVGNVGDVVSFGDQSDKRWKITGHDTEGRVYLKPLWK